MKYIIIFLLILGPNFILLYSFQENYPPKISAQPNLSDSQNYTSHAPISISSNDDFITLGFPGSGSPENPYRIEGIKIQSSSFFLIEINFVTKHFVIRNNYLNGLNIADSGIFFNDVTNGIVSNNIIVNNTHGVYFGDTTSNSVFMNTLSENVHGIMVASTSKENTFSNNNITKNGQGINIEGADNFVVNNSISNSIGYGIFLGIDSSNNLVNMNNFIDNKIVGSQGLDNGFNNTLINNYYNEWTDPDENSDGIVDTFYPLDGGANNVDSYPLTALRDLILTTQTIPLIQTNENALLFPQLLLITILSLIVLGLGYIRYTLKLKKEESFTDFLYSNKSEIIRALYNKIIIGLENSKAELTIKPTEIRAFPLIDRPILVNTFPADIRKDLISGLKGRSIVVLVEIAYQHISDTNPAYLSDVLNIPRTTITAEIKRLIRFQYVKPYVSKKVLLDTRYRTYSVTDKGIEFLHYLKYVLKISLERLNETQYYS